MMGVYNRDSRLRMPIGLVKCWGLVKCRAIGLLHMQSVTSGGSTPSYFIEFGTGN